MNMRDVPDEASFPSSIVKTAKKHGAGRRGAKRRTGSPEGEVLFLQIRAQEFKSIIEEFLNKSPAEWRAMIHSLTPDRRKEFAETLQQLGMDLSSIAEVTSPLDWNQGPLYPAEPFKQVWLASRPRMVGDKS